MTDKEVLEIERIWRLESSRKEWNRNSMIRDSSFIEEVGGFHNFFKKVFKSHGSVVLLSDGGLTEALRDILSEKTATKRIYFSDCYLLFKEDFGLLLVQRK